MSASADDGAWLLEARSVSRRFGGLLAVDAVDLVVRRGSVHGLIGPNGAGKTTLLNLVAGVYRVSSGALRFGARDITQHSTAKRARAGIRRTFQNLKLFGEMTALENVYALLRRDHIVTVEIGAPLLEFGEILDGFERALRAKQPLNEHAP